MDGGKPPADPLVQRAAQIGRICRGFGCLPSQAERELENDPDQLALVILDLWGYSEAKSSLDAATDKAKAASHWAGNPYMTLVQTNTLEMRLSAQDAVDGR